VNISESSEERGPRRAEVEKASGQERTGPQGSMFIIPYGAPEGYEWFVTLVVLVCLISPFAISCERGADLALAAPSSPIMRRALS
jgi:hypothetical protein